MSMQSTWSCLRPATRQLPSAVRAFSTTPATLAGSIPPESPKYIRLPNTPQSDETKPERVRGHLPVPREIFSRKDGNRKLSPEYIQKSAPTRASDAQPKNETQRWKKELADSRRKNLEEGIHALWERYETKNTAMKARTAKKYNDNLNKARAGESKLDRITRGTVMDALLDTKVYPDPKAARRSEVSQSKSQSREIAKSKTRMDAITELYITASNFIVSEADLKAEIDKVFTEDHFRKMARATDRFGGMENVWGVYGKPPSVGNMLESTAGTSTKLMDRDETEFDRSVKRQKRIAEEFTGGKME